MEEVDFGADALLALLAIGAIGGIVSVWVFRRWSDRERLRRAINAVTAHLLEFRLFADEPWLLLRAQRDLVVANARLLRSVLLPSGILLVPFGILLTFADGFFSHAALRLNEATVLTVQGLDEPRPQGSGFAENVRIGAPPGIIIETSGVRIPREKEVSWQVRATRPMSGAVSLFWNGREFRKRISAGPGLRWVSTVSTFNWFGSPVKTIRIEYPRATVWGANWLAWFSLSSCLSAVLAAVLAQR